MLLTCFIKIDFHIVTYTNTYNAAMHNSNNTVIIAQFLPCYLTRDGQSGIEQDIYSTVCMNNHVYLRHCGQVSINILTHNNQQRINRRSTLKRHLIDILTDN